MASPLNEKEDNFQVILPCAPNEFGSFIAALLGKPKTLKGVTSGHFTVGTKEISNFYHLIHQKVQSQNHGSLVNLSISVYYSNGLSVTHHNPEDFESYHPTSKSTPTQVVLSFVYLIKFNGKLSPEKQEIDITISADRDDTREDRAHWSHSGLCKYVISHTDTSWATDISNIIKSHAETIIEKPSAIKEYFTTRFGEILNIGTSGIFACILIYWAIYTNGRMPELADIDAKLLFLTNSIVIITILYLICKSVTYLIDMYLSLYGYSFICLTEKDYKNKEIADKRIGKRWLYYMGGWIINIACGLLSSIIFRFI